MLSEPTPKEKSIWQSLLDSTDEASPTRSSTKKTLFLLGGDESAQALFVDNYLCKLHISERANTEASVKVKHPGFYNELGVSYHYIQYFLSSTPNYQSKTALELMLHLDVYAVDQRSITRSPSNIAAMLREVCCGKVRDLLVVPLLDWALNPQSFLQDLRQSIHGVVAPIFAEHNDVSLRARKQEMDIFFSDSVDMYLSKDLRDMKLLEAADSDNQGRRTALFPCNMLLVAVNAEDTERVERVWSSTIVEYIQIVLRIASLAVGGSLCYLHSQPTLARNVTQFNALMHHLLGVSLTFREIQAVSKPEPVLSELELIIPVGWDSLRKMGIAVLESPQLDQMIGETSEASRLWVDMVTRGEANSLSEAYAGFVPGLTDMATLPIETVPDNQVQQSNQEQYQSFLHKLSLMAQSSAADFLPASDITETDEHDILREISERRVAGFTSTPDEHSKSDKELAAGYFDKLVTNSEI
ncbi:hypothetical protein BABINDRAFT_165633 [Babjeviella inositovora NRRL Y-12698]|uniref:Dynein light intermediate chain n=1 Tax=Babjeviella inositovora NRRL Y-12698 TaxID=984486 RepID=A0A1E3QWT9_9ASCO|nr:uncharacterized protein BABINDRAFT_165633 [Babjeviella inositovora NRRL Y-12698]ODQ82145.1 hypothetical protein BABINDRAFT_165633 [Babjeviella inositovora NRRL Y-12698]